MLKRDLSYLKHIYLMTINNPLRFFLSALGFFIAILVFSIGNILINSYYDSQFEAVNEIDDKTVFTRIVTENDDYSEFIKNIDKENCVYVSVSDEKKTLFVEEKTGAENSYRLVLSATIMGISKNANGVLPVMHNDYEYAQVQTKLIKGRYIDVQDVSNNSMVVVIDQLTEKILFGNEDSLGKEINLNGNHNGTVSVGSEVTDNSKAIKVKVVGVVENTHYSKVQEKMLEKYLDGAMEYTYIESIIYCPISMMESEGITTNGSYYLWNYDSKVAYKEKLNLLENFKSYYEGSGVSVDIYDKEAMENELENEMKALKLLMYSVIIVLIVISGISTMNIMFFSVKERINEIGIKKALGATKLDIVIQFILEGQIIGLFSGTLAVAISCVVTKLVEAYINNEMYIYFAMNISLDTIMLPIGLSVIFSFIFSLIPSIYGANINVTKALRFE